MAHPVTLFQPVGHLIDHISGITDLIIGSHPDFPVEVASMNALQYPDDILKGFFEVVANHNGQQNTGRHEKKGIDHYIGLQFIQNQICILGRM